MTLARKFAGLARELKRPGVTTGDKLLRVAQGAVSSLGLSPGLSIRCCVIVETVRPPAQTRRGLSDLNIRRGELRDLPALIAVDNRDPALFRARLERGDLVYLGEVGGDVLCHTWFHRGPTPFDEERSIYSRWAVD